MVSDFVSELVESGRFWCGVYTVYLRKSRDLLNTDRPFSHASFKPLIYLQQQFAYSQSNFFFLQCSTFLDKKCYVQLKLKQN